MKTLHLSMVVIAILLLVPLMMNNPAKAGCSIPIHSDWPNAPCYGCPGCIPSKEKQQEDWAPYYQYKGAAWMAMMKAQMIEAMRNGTLEDWVTGNDSHYNVWRYYYLNDQTPFFRSSVSGLNDERPYFPPPLQQLTTGIAPKDVVCKKGLNLVINAEDGSPACVKPTTAQKLVERGWAKQTTNYLESRVGSNSLVDVVSIQLVPPPNPGGPTIQLTLKNIGVNPITSLKAVLELNNNYTFDFKDVTPSTPLVPGNSTSDTETLVGAGSTTGMTYPLTVVGTVNNETFSYTLNVHIPSPNLTLQEQLGHTCIGGPGMCP